MGNKLATFMWEYDTYSFWDTYDNIEEAKTEIKKELNNDTYRQGVLDYLYDIAINDEDFEWRIKAAKLYREVMDYGIQQND